MTTIARNYLPHARVMAASLRRHHPDVRLSVLVVDEPHAVPADEPFERLSPLELGIDERELHHRAMLFDAQGLISSLKPLALLALLAEGEPAVLQIDADMLVFGPFPELWEQAAEAGVLLSPHAFEPVPGRPGDWHELEFLRGGAFNDALMGVGPEAGDFLRWLADRTARDSVRSPEDGLLYSQTWLNLVPSLFPHRIIRDRGLNAMVHNLHGRDLEWQADGPRVAGAPLRLFHFSGFDPAEPWRLTRYYPNEVTELGSRPGLAQLCRDYAASVQEEGWPVAEGYGWGSLTRDLPVDAAMRAAYREALMAAEAGVGAVPPDPFAPGELDAFLAWLRSPPTLAPLSRYLLHLRRERRDLRDAFPAAPGPDTQAYLHWAENHGEVPAELATTGPVTDGSPRWHAGRWRPRPA